MKLDASVFRSFPLRRRNLRSQLALQVSRTRRCFVPSLRVLLLAAGFSDAVNVSPRAAGWKLKWWVGGRSEFFTLICFPKACNQKCFCQPKKIKDSEINVVLQSMKAQSVKKAGRSLKQYCAICRPWISFSKVGATHHTPASSPLSWYYPASSLICVQLQQ